MHTGLDEVTWRRNADRADAQGLHLEALQCLEAGDMGNK